MLVLIITSAVLGWVTIGLWGLTVVQPKNAIGVFLLIVFWPIFMIVGLVRVFIEGTAERRNR